jgi:hypothetical protein
VKLAIIAGVGSHFEGRIIRLESGGGAVDRVMLWVMHNPAYVAENSRIGRSTQENNESKDEYADPNCIGYFWVMPHWSLLWSFSRCYLFWQQFLEPTRK